MSSQLSAHAITAHTAMTRISVSRCSTLPAHRGSARAEKCSTSFSTDIVTLPSSIKGEPAQPVSPSEPARPFHALPLGSTGRSTSTAVVKEIRDGHREIRAALDSHWAASDANDLEGEHNIYREDAVLEYPQS